MALDTHVAILTVAVCVVCGTRPALTLATRQSTHVAFNEKWQQVHAISVHMTFEEQQNDSVLVQGYAVYALFSAYAARICVYTV